ncbi:MAG: hypothetical protein KJ645_11470 [Planctomycetes bacterium]|nr:hypothetical protein [Planctomycetota bacterium]
MSIQHNPLLASLPTLAMLLFPGCSENKPSLPEEESDALFNKDRFHIDESGRVIIALKSLDRVFSS